MRLTALTTLLFIFAASAWATFELDDPANEAMEKLQEEKLKASGETACKLYTKGRKKNNETYFTSLQWLLGYFNEKSPQTAAGLDPDAMARWIDTYCQAHPRYKLEAAAEEYLEETRGDS